MPPLDGLARGWSRCRRKFGSKFLSGEIYLRRHTLRRSVSDRHLSNVAELDVDAMLEHVASSQKDQGSPVAVPAQIQVLERTGLPRVVLRPFLRQLRIMAVPRSSISITSASRGGGLPSFRCDHHDAPGGAGSELASWPVRKVTL